MRRLSLEFFRLEAVHGFGWMSPPQALISDLHAYAQDPHRCRELAEFAGLALETRAEFVVEAMVGLLEAGQIQWSEDLPTSVDDAVGTSSPLVELSSAVAEVLEVNYRLVIALVGDDDRPLPGLAYQVIGADGRTRRGRLDDEGRAEIQDIGQAGDCAVSFPELDQDAWEYVSAKPL